MVQIGNINGFINFNSFFGTSAVSAASEQETQTTGLAMNEAKDTETEIKTSDENTVVSSYMPPIYKRLNISEMFKQFRENLFNIFKREPIIQPEPEPDPEPLKPGGGRPIYYCCYSIPEAY